MEYQQLENLVKLKNELDDTRQLVKCLDSTDKWKMSFCFVNRTVSTADIVPIDSVKARIKEVVHEEFAKLEQSLQSL